MKRLILLISMLSLLFLTGCAKDDEIYRLTQENELLGLELQNYECPAKVCPECHVKECGLQTTVCPEYEVPESDDDKVNEIRHDIYLREAKHKQKRFMTRIKDKKYEDVTEDLYEAIDDINTGLGFYELYAKNEDYIKAYEHLGTHYSKVIKEIKDLDNGDTFRMKDLEDEDIIKYYNYYVNRIEQYNKATGLNIEIWGED